VTVTGGKESPDKNSLGSFCYRDISAAGAL